MEILMELGAILAYVVVEYVVYFLFAFAMAYVIKLIKDKELKDIVEEAVLFAQQAGEDYGLNNDEKLQEAINYVIESVSLRFGLKEDRVESLIKATLKRLKKEFKDQW